MKGHFVLILLILTACGATSQSQQNNQQGNLVNIRFTSDQDLNFTFNSRTYFLKSGKMEEVDNVPRQANYTIITSSPSTYKTTNLCFNTLCTLKGDKRGSYALESLSDGSFKIILTGDVRKPIFCLIEHDVWFSSINAQETDIPLEDKDKFDKCYIPLRNESFVVNRLQNQSYNISTRLTQQNDMIYKPNYTGNGYIEVRVKTLT